MVFMRDVMLPVVSVLKPNLLRYFPCHQRQNTGTWWICTSLQQLVSVLKPNLLRYFPCHQRQNTGTWWICPSLQQLVSVLKPDILKYLLVIKDKTQAHDRYVLPCHTWSLSWNQTYSSTSPVTKDKTQAHDGYVLSCHSLFFWLLSLL